MLLANPPIIQRTTCTRHACFEAIVPEIGPNNRNLGEPLGYPVMNGQCRHQNGKTIMYIHDHKARPNLSFFVSLPSKTLKCGLWTVEASTYALYVMTASNRGFGKDLL